LTAVADPPAPGPAQPHRTRRALSAARTHLHKKALKLLGWVVFAFLGLKLLPGLKQALHSLEHVRWQWVAGALALEVLSELGFVLSWRSIVDPENLLERDGRGARTGTRAAWAQLGGGQLVPGGSLASIGVGAWILRRFGMPAQTIAERQFNLSFLNTAIDALALIVFGSGLATGIFAGEPNLMLTLLPAAVATIGIVVALLIARRATTYAERLKPEHPKVAGSITSLADAVDATDQILFHRGGHRSVLGALAYLGFDALVLWTAFFAVHAHPVPGFAVLMMAYIIGALGGSLPLPAGIGAVAGIAGMLILYGAAHNAAVAAVLLYSAVGLLVPLIGGAIGYLFLRRRFGSMQTLQQGELPASVPSSPRRRDG
jgi:uncharacterized membrane protein YbhN (UPF0104 family)